MVFLCIVHWLLSLVQNTEQIKGCRTKDVCYEMKSSCPVKQYKRLVCVIRSGSCAGTGMA